MSTSIQKRRAIEELKKHGTYVDSSAKNKQKGAYSETIKKNENLRNESQYVLYPKKRFTGKATVGIHDLVKITLDEEREKREKMSEAERLLRQQQEIKKLSFQIGGKHLQPEISPELMAGVKKVTDDDILTEYLVRAGAKDKSDPINKDLLVKDGDKKNIKKNKKIGKDRFQESEKEKKIKLRTPVVETIDKKVERILEDSEQKEAQKAMEDKIFKRQVIRKTPNKRDGAPTRVIDLNRNRKVNDTRKNDHRNRIDEIVLEGGDNSQIDVSDISDNGINDNSVNDASFIDDVSDQGISNGDQQSMIIEDEGESYNLSDNLSNNDGSRSEIYDE